MKQVLIIVLSILCCLPAVAQEWATRGMKDWEEGPLVPADFVTRNATDTSLVGSLKWYYMFDREEKKVGNLRYEYYRVSLKMDKLNSWYDPSSDICATEYLQNEFDIAEAVRRRMQNEILENPRDTWEVRDYFYRSLQSRIDTYHQESRFGQDREVVTRYASDLAAELDSLTVDTLHTPAFGKKKGGIGMFVGYNAEIFAEPAGAGVPMGNCFDLGLNIPVGRFSFLTSMCFGFGTRLREDGFYHDDSYDYDWVKGKKVSAGTMNIMGGYHFLDKDYYSVMPFVGIGVGFLDQKMDPDHIIDREHTSSEIDGFRALAGLQFSYKFRRTFDVFGGALSESSVNFRLYGASTKFEQVGRTFSINLGVTLDWTGFFTK